MSNENREEDFFENEEIKNREEIPEKKKAAIGVRGIKLSLDDRVEEVYLLNKDTETTIIYNDKPVSLNRLKLGHRDTKGIKIRV